MSKPNIMRFIVASFLLLMFSGCKQVDQIRGVDLPDSIARAEAALARNDRKSAISLFDQAIKAKPEAQVFSVVLQDVQIINDPDLVIKYGEQAISALPNAPSQAKAYLLRATANAHLQLGNFPKAIEYGQAAQKLLPEDFGTMNDLGYIYAEVSEPGAKESISRLQDALTLTTEAVKRARDAGLSGPEMGVMVDSLGWVFYKMQKYDIASRNLARAASLAPSSKEVQFHAAMTYIKLDKPVDAEVHLRKSLKLDPGFRPAKEALLNLNLK